MEGKCLMRESSISKEMKSNIHIKPYIPYCCSIVFWIGLWQFAANAIGNELFLPSPIHVWKELTGGFLLSRDVIRSIFTSLFHISKGFFLGLSVGVAFAIVSAMWEPVRILLWFPIKLIKTIPVASFVILALLWRDSSELSVILPFLMVVPTIYIHTLTGIRQMEKTLLEMAEVFQVSLFRKIRYLYFPEVLPHIASSASIAVGMAWKSGIAAEIIGLSQGTIGNRLYQAKIYLNTPEMFAWTILIVILCMICEGIIKQMMCVLEKL